MILYAKKTVHARPLTQKCQVLNIFEIKTPQTLTLKFKQRHLGNSLSFLQVSYK